MWVLSSGRELSHHVTQHQTLLLTQHLKQCLNLMVHVDELLVSGFSFEALGAEGGLMVLPLRSLLLHVCLNWSQDN